MRHRGKAARDRAACVQCVRCCAKHDKKLPVDGMVLLIFLKVCYPRSFCRLHQSERYVEVTNFRLTRDHLRVRMLLTHMTKSDHTTLAHWGARAGV